jgi:hypothetical protein
LDGSPSSIILQRGGWEEEREEGEGVKEEKERVCLREWGEIKCTKRTEIGPSWSIFVFILPLWFLFSFGRLRSDGLSASECFSQYESTVLHKVP